MERLVPFSTSTRNRHSEDTAQSKLEKLPGTRVERLVNLELLDVKIHQLLSLAKSKPYISYWGEVYYLLYSIKKKGQSLQQNLVLYDLPSGKMTYSYLKNRFVAVLPDMNISLQDHELTDALFQGRFVPVPIIAIQD